MGFEQLKHPNIETLCWVQLPYIPDNTCRLLICMVGLLYKHDNACRLLVCWDGLLYKPD